MWILSVAVRTTQSLVEPLGLFRQEVERSHANTIAEA
jgi:hypothetical protein